MNDFSEKEIKVRQSRFPASLFWTFFGVCSLMSGLHQGLLILMDRLEWSGIIQTHAALLYWLIVAAALTFYVRRRIRKTYEIPLQRISHATRQVAQGEFFPCDHCADQHHG